MKRLWLAIAAIVALGVIAPLLPLEIFRPSIERALERALNRRVEVGNAHLTLFTGPGLSIESVTIHEDPRAGIEPFAYMDTLDAGLDWMALLHGRLRLASLHLGDATINLVKTDNGPWNFQYLLNPDLRFAGSARAEANPGSGHPPSESIPSIRMRGGRVNLKFGPTKSVLYFDDADLDVSSDDGAMELRFSGAPKRTDRSAQDFGHFFVRGTARPTPQGQQLDLRAELEPSSLDGVAHLFDQRGFNIQGVVALEAQLSGLPSNLKVTGQLQFDDIHRWDLLPQRGGRWRLDYQGSLDLSGEKLALASTETVDSPLAVQFQAWNLLTSPQWRADMELKEAPLGTFVEVARHMGAAIPEKLTVHGSVSGAVCYQPEIGFSGSLRMQESEFSLPDLPLLKAETVPVVMDGQRVSFGPAEIDSDDNQTAQAEGSFTFGQALDVKITTRGLKTEDARVFGLPDVPLMSQVSRGTWRGWMRYRLAAGEKPVWSGEYDLQNARVAVDGIADPLRIQSASVSADGQRLVVSRIKAKVGDVAFSGDYRWEPKASRPHQFRLVVEEANADEIQRLVRPVLARSSGGFFSRTLRLGAPEPVPEWLVKRRAAGTIAVRSLNFGDTRLTVNTASLIWDGVSVKLSGIDGALDDSPVHGSLLLDLSNRTPRYCFEGKLEDFAYKGGRLDFSGRVESFGTGTDLLAGLRANGTFRGRSIQFTPETEFRSVAGGFELTAGAGGLRWKLSELEIAEGADIYSGAGGTQPDGKLALDLSSRGRQVRYLGSLVTLAGQP